MSVLFLDHRQLADEMEIYFIDAQIGAGLPVWLPNGVAIRDALESFIKELERRQGYERVVSPHIGKSSLYECSGHLRNYRQEMFPPFQWPDEEGQFYLKPMNCPHHHKVFAALPRSFRQLPLRLAEYGQVYRFENSGSLKGLSRARGLCQNDAHIYIDPEQAASELDAVLALHEQCYRAIGLSSYRYRLSKHDPARPDVFEGSRHEWQLGEDLLRQALNRRGLEFFESVGDAAFYGPKIDVQMKINNQAEESIASIQLDMISAARFDLSFIGSDGEKHRPWIIHRAPLGSHECFVAVLLEFYQGRLPAWLSPVQVLILPVSENQMPAAQALAEKIRNKGFRPKVDVCAGSLSKRIHFAHRLRPVIKIILGAKEQSQKIYNLQNRESQIEIPESSLLEVLARKLKPPTP